MKKLNTITVFVIALLFTGFTTSAQSDDILSGVDDTKNYTTMDLIAMDRDLSTFANLLRMSGLANSAEIGKDHTVLAPTNQAFREMSLEDFAQLTDPENRTDLVAFVQYHFLPSKAPSYEFTETSVISTSFDTDIPVSVDKNYDRIYIGGARVIKGDIEASNGLVHVVNGVVNPADGITGTK